MSATIEQWLTSVSTVEMDRPEDEILRPETPEQAVAMQFDGTEFGFYWKDGVPHALIADTECDGFASGEQHHYRQVRVSLQEVIDAQ